MAASTTSLISLLPQRRLGKKTPESKGKIQPDQPLLALTNTCRHNVQHIITNTRSNFRLLEQLPKLSRYGSKRNFYHYRLRRRQSTRRQHDRWTCKRIHCCLLLHALCRVIAYYATHPQSTSPILPLNILNILSLFLLAFKAICGSIVDGATYSGVSPQLSRYFIWIW